MSSAGEFQSPAIDVDIEIMILTCVEQSFVTWIAEAYTWTIRSELDILIFGKDVVCMILNMSPSSYQARILFLPWEFGGYISARNECDTNE